MPAKKEGAGDIERMYRETEARQGLSEYLDALIDQAVAEAGATKDPEASEKHRRRFDMLHELKEASPKERAELLKEARQEKIFTPKELMAMLEAEGPGKPEAINLDSFIEDLIQGATQELEHAPDKATKDKLGNRIAILHEIKGAVGTPENKFDLVEEALAKGLVTQTELKGFQVALGIADMEGRPPREKTPEELKAEKEKEDRRRMTYRLITGDIGAEPPKDFTPSPKMEKITEKWQKARETVLKAHEDKARIEKQVKVLERELAVLRKGKDISAIGAKESELQWAQNKLLALQNLDTVESAFAKSQEELKRQLINEFLVMKRKQIKEYLKVHKESYLKTLEQKFRERHGKAKDYELTKADKERMVDELLQDEALDRGAKIIGDTIVSLDQGFEKEKINRTLESKDKGRAEKLLEKWNKMSLGKKIALSAAVGAGIASGAMFYTGGFSMAALGAVTLGAVAYRGARSLVGLATAAVTKLGGNFLVNKIFGRKREKAREERIEMTMLNMKAAVAEGEIWIKNEQKKLEFAKIIDAMADEHRKKIEALAKKEKWSKRGVTALAILAGGAAAYWGTDYLFGGPPKGGMTMADLLERGKDKAPQGMPYDFGMDEGIAPPPEGLPVAPTGEQTDPFLMYEPPTGEQMDPSLVEPYPEQLGGPGVMEVEAVPGAPFKAEAMLGRRGIWGGVEEILKEKAKTDPALAEVLKNPAKSTYLIDMIKDKEVADPDQ